MSDDKQRDFLADLRSAAMDIAIMNRGNAPVWTERELLELFGSEMSAAEGRAAIAQAVEAGLLQPAGGIDGIYSRPILWMQDAVPPSPFTVAVALARHRGWKFVAGQRHAEGALGIRERYDDYWPNPGLIAVEGIDEIEEFGDWNGRPVVVVEPGPDWVFALSNSAVDVVAQAFRGHLDDPNLEALIHGAAVRRAGIRKQFRDPLEEGLESLPADLQEVARKLLQAIDELDRGGFVPAQSAPVNWMPPATWDGATVSGDWCVVEMGIRGARRRVLTGGRLRGHPYLLMPTPHWRSSPLVWIDRDLGWARTESRLYKLEGKGGELTDEDVF